MNNQNCSGYNPKVLIISGEPRSGKTSLCQIGVAWCNIHGILQTGIISPGIYADATRIAIQAYSVQHNTMRLLGVCKDLQQNKTQSHIAELKKALSQPYIETHCWRFSEAVFTECTSWIATEPDAVFWIDELGILEFKLHKGYVKAFEVLRTQLYKLAIAVIRPSLVPLFSQYVPDVPYEVIHIPHHAHEKPEFVNYFLNFIQTCNIQQ